MTSSGMGHPRRRGSIGVKRISTKRGLPPGSAVYVGEKTDAPITVSVIDYDADNLQERTEIAADRPAASRAPGNVTWINCDGIHDPALITRIGESFGLHPLVIEDILNTDQRPKIDIAEHYVFVVVKMLYPAPDNGLTVEQVSLVFGEGFLLSFQERAGDVFDPVRKRLREGPRRRFIHSDYLAYALIDAIVDGYFLVLEQIGDRVESIEHKLVAHPTAEDLETIHRLKRELVVLRKPIWPLREVIGGMSRSETPLIDSATGVYIRDLYEHAVQVLDTVETYRDMVSGLLDVYLTSVSNRMNEVMKVLTVIATIFIPLTFLAGVYGMNFSPEVGGLNMPELRWPYGYVTFWGASLALGIGLLVFFRRKGWL